MKSFAQFAEDGAAAGGTATGGVAGAGDNPSKTVPVSKKMQKKYTNPRRITGAPYMESFAEFTKKNTNIKTGEQTAPAATFMTKEEVEELDEAKSLAKGINHLGKPVFDKRNGNTGIVQNSYADGSHSIKWKGHKAATTHDWSETKNHIRMATTPDEHKKYVKEEVDLQEAKPLGKFVKTVNGYQIHDLGANTPHKDKRFLAYHNEYAYLSHSSPTEKEITSKSKEKETSGAIPKRTEHDDWRDDMKHRVQSGEIRRAVQSRRGMSEDTKSGNLTYGYHGTINAEDDADRSKKYAAAHSQAKRLLTAHGHLQDARHPNVMVKNFLDSPHGRHIADIHNDKARPDAANKEILSRFKHFKKTYDRKDFNEDTLEAQKKIISSNSKTDENPTGFAKSAKGRLLDIGNQVLNKQKEKR
jgi:hypothetical protein